MAGTGVERQTHPHRSIVPSVSNADISAYNEAKKILLTWEL